MQRTTSQQTRSKRRTSKFALIALIGVWGCAPDPDLVYVDLNAAELRSTTTAVSAHGFSSEAYSLERSVPTIEGTDVFFGSAEQRAVEALNVYRETQRQATQAVLERLKRTFLNEVDLTVKTEKAEVDKLYGEMLTTEVAELYVLFLEHAKMVEPLRFELTQIVGFPDPDPRSLKVPLESNEKAYGRFLKARTIREQIIALDATYRAEVVRRMGAIEDLRQARLATIDLQGDAMRAEAVQRAKQEADKVSADALAALEPTALDPDAQLPAVPGASSSVNSGPVSVASPPSLGALRETTNDLEAQLEVFLKTYRYRRTRDASLGRDATREFLEWRRKYTDGR